MENVNCILCNSDINTIVKTFKILNNTFTLVKCKCDFIFLNPRPDIHSIKKYYSNQYLSNQLRESFFFKKMQYISFNWKYKIISKVSENYTGTSLDIGSGNNSFSNFLESKGWNTLSYDLNNKYLDISDMIRLEDNSIDLITMWHSIEHFHNINDIFKIIKKKIKSTGYLIIACPNIDAAEISILKDNWIAYDIPRHIYHFNPQSLDTYVSKFNFKVISKYKMLQDTVFNIFLSLNHCNFIIRTVYFFIILIYSIIAIYFGNNKSSSYTYICKIN